MKKIVIRSVVLLLVMFAGTVFVNGQDSLGKLFIRAQMAEIDGKQVSDSELEESVKDMKKRPGKFTLVEKENEADWLIVVNERVAAPMAGSPSAKRILATLYQRINGEWEPATKLQSGTRDTFWGMAAEKVIKNAAKWIKEKAEK